MATPQELYDETKTRLDLNIAKAQMLEKEIQQKIAEKNQPLLIEIKNNPHCSQGFHWHKKTYFVQKV